MGTPVKTLSQVASLIASDNTWVEGLAVEQLKKTAQLPGMVKVAGMPDLHPGKGYPIGAAFFSTGQLYPALVGNDIGCGMALWQTSLKVQKANLDKLSKRLAHVEGALDDSWIETIAARKHEKKITNNRFDQSLGTIGGGNHFAEFQAVECVYQEAEFKAANIDKKQLVLLVHSGSRGLGQSILVDHTTEFNHDGISDQNPAQQDYLSLHDEAVRWAELNREMIARRFLASIRERGDCLLDVNHNLVVAKNIAGTSGWLHRKGATPSDAGLVVIPGSRGDFSYLVKPTPADTALFSLAHGAGRKWKRGDCKDRLSHKYKREDLYRTALGSRVICNDKELLYDEAPQAYKDCESIVNDLVEAGLATLVARLKPVLTFKTNGGRCT